MLENKTLCCLCYASRRWVLGYLLLAFLWIFLSVFSAIIDILAITRYCYVLYFYMLFLRDVLSALMTVATSFFFDLRSSS